MKTAIYAVTVRRDANTIIPAEAPKHEIPVLKHLFGAENVTLGAVIGYVDLDEATEHERLAAKYNEEAVTAVHGPLAAGKVADLMRKASEKPGAKE